MKKRRRECRDRERERERERKREGKKSFSINMFFRAIWNLGQNRNIAKVPQTATHPPRHPPTNHPEAPVPSRGTQHTNGRPLTKKEGRDPEIQGL